MRVIAVDPSGNFEEGKGHTGIAVLDGDDFNNVKVMSFSAKDFDTRFYYWTTILHEIDMMCTEDTTVVIESYVMRNNGFTIGKQPETAMLIGVLVWGLEVIGIPYVFQTPSSVKTRFKDDLLPKYFPKLTCDTSTGKARYFYDGKIVSDHIRDAMRHLLFYKKYKEKKDGI